MNNETTSELDAIAELRSQNTLLSSFSEQYQQISSDIANYIIGHVSTHLEYHGDPLVTRDHIPAIAVIATAKALLKLEAHLESPLSFYEVAESGHVLSMLPFEIIPSSFEYQEHLTNEQRLALDVMLMITGRWPSAVGEQEVIPTQPKEKSCQQ